MSLYKVFYNFWMLAWSSGFSTFWTSEEIGLVLFGGLICNYVDVIFM